MNLYLDLMDRIAEVFNQFIFPLNVGINRLHFLEVSLMELLEIFKNSKNMEEKLLRLDIYR